MKHRAVTGEGFKDYYVNQIGHGMPVFAGATMQRGHGMGNILRGLLRVAMPLIKSVGKSALKKSAPVIKEVGARALKRGLDMAATEMSDPKRSKSAHVIGKTIKDVANRVPVKARKRKPKAKDIFDSNHRI